MDFLYFLVAVLLGLLLMFSILVARIRKRKRSVNIENIGDVLTEVKDDADEPARWVP